MNYLILDTEKTYNYGYILLNDKGEILLKRNLVITNNFENRNIIGETEYNRKNKIYQTDPFTYFVSSTDGAAMIVKDFSDYQIDYIIAHNCSEDRRQLENLSQQTGVKFPQIPFYDSINLVKLLFPANIKTGLAETVQDITGKTVKQNHIAIQDCELLYSFIVPIISYLGYFIEYQEIFAHDNDYEITYKVLTNLDKILPLPKTVEAIKAILNIESRGDKTKLTNFFKKAERSYDFWKLQEKTKYSEKTGKALETKELEVCSSNNFETAYNLGRVMVSLDVFKEHIIASCSGEIKEVGQINNNTPDYTEELEGYKRLVREYEIRLQNYDDYLNQKLHEHKQQISNYEEENLRLKEENSSLRAARRRPRTDSATIEKVFLQRMIQNFNTLAHGSIFNKKSRLFKKYLKKRNAQALFDLLWNN